MINCLVTITGKITKITSTLALKAQQQLPNYHIVVQFGGKLYNMKKLNLTKENNSKKHRRICDIV